MELALLELALMDPSAMEPLLAALKDIHLPEVQGTAADSQYVLWPFFVFAALCAAVGWLIWRRKTHWRRQVTAELLQIEQQQHHDPAAAWQGLALLLRRVAMHSSQSHPDSTNPAANVARFTGEAWLQRLDNLFHCNTFTAGAGRDLISIPYRKPPRAGTAEQQFDRQATQLTKRTAESTSQASPVPGDGEVAGACKSSTANLSQLISVVRGGLRTMPNL